MRKSLLAVFAALAFCCFPRLNPKRMEFLSRRFRRMKRRPMRPPLPGSLPWTLTGNSLSVNETFSGLIGGNGSAAHIHCCCHYRASAAATAVPFPVFRR